MTDVLQLQNPTAPQIALTKRVLTERQGANRLMWLVLEMRAAFWPFLVAVARWGDKRKASTVWCSAKIRPGSPIGSASIEAGQLMQRDRCPRAEALVVAMPQAVEDIREQNKNDRSGTLASSQAAEGGFKHHALVHS
jgi:hypothetical protein